LTDLLICRIGPGAAVIVGGPVAEKPHALVDHHFPARCTISYVRHQRLHACLLTGYHGLTVQSAGFFHRITFGSWGGAGCCWEAGPGTCASPAAATDGCGLRLEHAGISGPLFILALACAPGAFVPFAAAIVPACLLLYITLPISNATIQDIVPANPARDRHGRLLLCHVPAGCLVRTGGTGWLSDTLARRAAAAGGGGHVGERHRAAGLHQAMYIVPVLGVVLALVLFLAARELRKTRMPSLPDSRR